MDFTTTGNNLNVLICSEYNLHNDWMSFFSWYTLHTFLPEATIAISCTRNKESTQSLYNWPVRCKTKCFTHKNKGFAESIQTALKNGLISTPLIVIPCNIFAIKELSYDCIESLQSTTTGTNTDNSIWYFKNKHNQEKASIINFNSFANYSELKNFDLATWWEKKKSHPFGLYWKYAHNQMSHTEASILNLWKKVKPLYENFCYAGLF